MTKHTFDYDHLCDLLYTILPADFQKELSRLKLPEKKLRPLLKRHAREQRDRLLEIAVEQGELSKDKNVATLHLSAVLDLLS